MPARAVRTKPSKPPFCMTPNSDSEQLPSPLTAAETSLGKAVNDGTAKQGSREGMLDQF